MGEELHGLDRWIEREDGEGEPAPPRMPTYAHCYACGQQDQSCNQRVCRFCGSTSVKHFGGGVMRRRRYDE